MALALIVVALIIAIYGLPLLALVRRMRVFWVYGEKIPGPPAMPIIGNVPMLIGKTSEELYEIFTGLARSAQLAGHSLIRMLMLGKLYVFPLSGKSAATILESTEEIDKGSDYHILKPWLDGGLILLREREFLKLESHISRFHNLKGSRREMAIASKNADADIPFLQTRRLSGGVQRRSQDSHRVFVKIC
ncbi:unnamed protein product [Caenorhabditis bovis]|uniref:Cytochrome P450 n=1 Tax=Caenorhabditis bovis TaxID=2654633 RepID=A0A8S1EGB0_9PELO|nr:unnamed protein product [Caenorhabditis bovis]